MESYIAIKLIEEIVYNGYEKAALLPAHFPQPPKVISYEFFYAQITKNVDSYFSFLYKK